MVRGDGVLMMFGWVAISSWGHLKKNLFSNCDPRQFEYVQ